MDWINPYTIGLGVFVVVLQFIVGRLRRQPGLVIAMNTAGELCLLAGIFWAISIGGGAFGAVAIATFGFVLYGMATERSRPKAPA